MDFILNLPDSKLPSYILCILVLLLIVLKDVNLRQNQKIGVTYLASFIMILLGWIEIWWGVFILFLADFALLELFTDDTEKTALFGVIYKTLDCLYKLFMEYYCFLFVGAVVVLSIGRSVIQSHDELPIGDDVVCWFCNESNLLSMLVLVIASAFILAAILLLSRMKFETKPVTSIMKELRGVDIYDVPIEKMGTKFNMLVAFEDKTFLDRNINSHTVLSPLIMRGALKYINKRTLLHSLQTAKKIFSRGYGTIEMQLIRNIGVERGYDTCVLRRKVFEVLYSSLIFNGYRRQFAANSDSAKNYKYWLLWCYMQKVPVKFSRRFFPAELSTAEQIFGKNFESLSLEEFFVWCISLEFFALIGPKTIMKRESIIIGYSLSESKIDTAVRHAYKAK